MSVNWPSILLWGFFATLLMTTLMSASQGLGLTRMAMPFLLGSMVTPDRNRANVAGFAFHFANGFAFAILYALAFESWRFAAWWLGAALGLLHGFVVLATVLPLLPCFHPRMATEDYGPDPTRQLEPPGFLGLNYGRRTPLVTLLAHVLYGAILGGLYQVTGR
jgi:hypothetical protein